MPLKAVQVSCLHQSRLRDRRRVVCYVNMMLWKRTSQFHCKLVQWSTGQRDTLEVKRSKVRVVYTRPNLDLEASRSIVIDLLQSSKFSSFRIHCVSVRALFKRNTYIVCSKHIEALLRTCTNILKAGCSLLITCLLQYLVMCLLSVRVWVCKTFTSCGFHQALWSLVIIFHWLW